MFNRELLQKKMDELGLNQYDLAAKVVTSQPMIAGIILGYKQPSLALASRIAAAVGCKVDDFVKKEE